MLQHAGIVHLSVPAGFLRRWILLLSRSVTSSEMLFLGASVSLTKGLGHRIIELIGQSTFIEKVLGTVENENQLIPPN